MKKLALGLVLCWAALHVSAAEATWLTDAATAQKKAKAENKLVLMDFTGSDWCSFCVKLRSEVFSKPEFTEYAKKNLVLVELDFPRSKPQTPALKKANKALQEKYNIKGFPTIIVLNGDGKIVGKLGYMPGGPKAFLAKLDEIKK